MLPYNLFIIHTLLLRRGGRRFDHNIANDEDGCCGHYTHQPGKSFGLAALPTSHRVKFLLPVRNGFSYEKRKFQLFEKRMHASCLLLKGFSFRLGHFASKVAVYAILLYNVHIETS